jgi:tRNA uridine 5-carbamoylmethylation protein Kti12
MKLSVSHNKKVSRRICDRCGENFTNLHFHMYTPWPSHSETNKTKSLNDVWRGSRVRSAYMQNIYLCNDCFIEEGKMLAKQWLDEISRIKSGEIKNKNELTDLQEVRHERYHYNKKLKEEKTEAIQTKHKERNVGLDVVSYAL